MVNIFSHLLPDIQWTLTLLTLESTLNILTFKEELALDSRCGEEGDNEGEREGEGEREKE